MTLKFKISLFSDNSLPGYGCNKLLCNEKAAAHVIYYIWVRYSVCLWNIQFVAKYPSPKNRTHQKASIILGTDSERFCTLSPSAI